VGEVHGVLKAVYVRVAQSNREEFQPNASRIAVQTGMTRADVTAYLRQDPEKVDAGAWDRSRAERVLTGWWNDEKYHDRLGKPLALRLRGPKSFASLVKNHAGEPRTLSILEELLRVRAVRKLPDGKLEVLSRTMANLRWDAHGIDGLGEHVRVYLETLAHNLKHPGQPRFSRVVLNAQLDPHYAPIVIRETNRQAEHFANVLERTINNPSATIKPKSRSQDGLRFSVSVSLWEEPVVIEPKPRTPPKGGRT
jgi:predicted transcriptional regulator